MSNIITIKDKSDQELRQIQKEFLEEKYDELLPLWKKGEILSKEDILSTFQTPDAPILDTDDGKHMIRRGEGENDIIIDYLFTYYHTTVEGFQDALEHALKLKNDAKSPFYRQTLEEKKAKKDYNLGQN